MPSPSPAEILAKCAEAYASCSTYQDTGETRTVMIHGSHPWDRITQRVPFRTFYERPDRLFFEYRQMTIGPEEEWHRAFVCASAASVVSWSTIPLTGVPLPTNLHDALGALMGVSGCSAGITPWLLFPNRQFTPLPDPATATVLGEEVVDDEPCHRLRGSRLSGSGLDVNFEVWIGADHLVRKIARRNEFNADSRRRQHEMMIQRAATLPADDPKRTQMEAFAGQMASGLSRDFVSEATTELHPRVNLPVDPSVFDVSAPPELAS
jgi:hypothetical protein